jgi:hypothetical protein
MRRSALAAAKLAVRESGGRGKPAEGSGPEPAMALKPRKVVKRPTSRRGLTTRDLGWTRQEAAKVRAQMGSFAADWDDPAMDIYNEP